MKTLAPILIFLSVLAVALPQVSLTFTRITDNNSANEGVGEAQFFADVIAANTNYVDFIFRNTGPVYSSITAVYFGDSAADSSLLSLYSIDDSHPGVSFSAGATPGNLPAGNTIGFQTFAGLSADSDPPVQPNGINPGEYLGITMLLAPNKTYDDVLQDLAAGRLRIGLHVQALANDSSESYISNAYSYPVIPAPPSLILAGLGSLVMGWLHRRRDSK